MIVYDLECQNGHDFDAWFRDSGSYDSQREAGDVACPACGDTEISKSIMAPSISTKGSTGEKAMPSGSNPQNMMDALQKMQKAVEENCDYVGKNFPEEARKIHYGESEHRNIYGESSFKEAQELTQEGIEVGCIPWRKKADG